MKYLKFFEKIVNSNSDIALKKFFDDYERYKKIYVFNTTHILKNYDIPEIFQDDIAILFFLYKQRYIWCQNIKKEDNYVKKNVKNYVVNSIIEKFKNNPQLYMLLKKCIEKRSKFNNRGSFQYISNSTIKYVFFLLIDAIKNTPDWIKDSEKYNL